MPLPPDAVAKLFQVRASLDAAVPEPVAEAPVDPALAPVLAAASAGAGELHAGFERHELREEWNRVTGQLAEGVVSEAWFDRWAEAFPAHWAAALAAHVLRGGWVSRRPQK